MKEHERDPPATSIKRAVLDVLKPREPPIYDLARKLAATGGITHVNIALAEIDQSTESVKVVIEGSDINIETVRKQLEELGAVIHSIDEIDVTRAIKKPS